MNTTHWGGGIVYHKTMPEILLVEETDEDGKSFWGYPGGIKKSEEDDYDTFARELGEEAHRQIIEKAKVELITGRKELKRNEWFTLFRTSVTNTRIIMPEFADPEITGRGFFGKEEIRHLIKKGKFKKKFINVHQELEDIIFPKVLV